MLNPWSPAESGCSGQGEGLTGRAPAEGSAAEEQELPVGKGSLQTPPES